MYDVAIIGGGPAGYVAAIRAGQVGLKTALIEKAAIGGMCLNWGCIPTKSLLESAKRYKLVKNSASFGVDGIDLSKASFNYSQAVKRTQSIVRRLGKGVEYLLKKNGVEHIRGYATLSPDHSIVVDSSQTVKAKHIIIATGSTPEPIPHVNSTVKVTEISELLQLKEIPQHIVIYGRGPHAIELAQFFALIDRNVTLLSPKDPLLPGLDTSLDTFVRKAFKKDKITLVNHQNITSIKESEITLETGSVPYDMIINANDRRGVIPDSEIIIEQRDGFISVNDHCQTNISNIYAIGDVNGKSSFAHAASAQGLHVVNHIIGIPEQLDFSLLPINIYTQPEIAQIGLTCEEIEKQGIEMKVSEFPLSANGKAMIEGQAEGFVRILSDKKYGEVIGVQIVAPHATDMIAEAATLMNLEGTIYDVAKVIHAHPTISEVFMEAGFDAIDQPIHK